MSAVSTPLASKTGCSIAAPTTITLPDKFVKASGKMSLVVKPTGAGSGNLAVSWVDSVLGATQVAKDDTGTAIVLSLADTSTLLIADLDIAQLILTPSAVSGVTDFAYSLTASHED